MLPAACLSVTVDLPRIRANARGIARSVGVPVYAVIKADAYGLGAARVAEALRDEVEGYCVFWLSEAIAADVWRRTGRETLAIGPPQSLSASDYLEQHVRPAVSTVEQAQALKAANPVLCVDTGMQRFACPAEHIEEVVRAGAIREAFTHATRLEHALRLADLLGGRGIALHAAASGLLDQPAARLDAVRPGLALYRGAVRVSTSLIETHETRSPVGYSEFTADRHGVIGVGYAQGLRKGPCLVNGEMRAILEVGMQSAYVEIGPGDRGGDEVVLLGDSLEPEKIARAWASTPHEALLRLASAGQAAPAAPTLPC